MMKITIVGTGYVGLVTGTCLAEIGNHVTCMEINEAKVAQMQKGESPIYEPGLEELLQANIAAGRLHFTTDLAASIKDAEIILLALPTPPDADGSADLSYVLDVADKLGPLLQHYTVVVTKSTVPVGTAEKVKARLSQSATVEFDVASNPEFLREGFAVYDSLHPDRIVVGASSAKARELLSRLYRPFVERPEQLICMDERSAEVTKYAANSFLAAKVTFMNEVANLCERVGADVDEVRLGVGADERIGHRFLMPGIGYGGSCFPKDVLAFSKTAAANDYDFRLLRAIIEVNARQKERLLDKALAYYGGDLSGKRFALWGLAFKPETDDIREAPALDIIQHFTDHGATVVGYDPQAMKNVKKHFGHIANLELAPDAYSALDGADALLIATEWEEFREPDIERMKKLLKAPTIFDGRNLFTPAFMQRAGFYYSSVGRELVREPVPAKT